MNFERPIKSEIDFQNWLTYTIGYKSFLQNIIKEDFVSELSYQSLIDVEIWSLNKYENPEAILIPSEADTFNNLARFIGEVFLYHLGGSWGIMLDDNQNAYYGMPIITDFKHVSSGLYYLCPEILLTTALHRRNEHFLLDRLKSKL
jgi:hypothetical protein